MCNNNYHFSLYISKGIRISDKTRVYPWTKELPVRALVDIRCHR